jgi:hypothetical protein
MVSESAGVDPLDDAVSARRSGWSIGWYNGWSPEQRLATLPVQREAIRAGAIPRPTICSICGSRENVWLHDENYADPLAAYHVCRPCHRALHERFDQPGPWLALVSRYKTGDRWFERLSTDPASCYRLFADTYPQGLPRT